jgi:hypothetical protein
MENREAFAVKIVAKRRRKLASYEVAGMSPANHRVLKGRQENSIVPCGTNSFWLMTPATLWLANLRRSSGATECGGRNCFTLDKHVWQTQSLFR